MPRRKLHQGCSPTPARRLGRIVRAAERLRGKADALIDELREAGGAGLAGIDDAASALDHLRGLAWALGMAHAALRHRVPPSCYRLSDASRPRP